MLNIANRLKFKNNSKIFCVSTWKTDNTSTGSSNNNQVKLPLESGGTYDFYVNWGDGNINHITVYNQAEVTHTYSTIGTYTIKIKGILQGWKFNDTGDKLKLLSFKASRNFNLGNNGGYFYGCSNLASITRLDISDMTNAFTMFMGCAKFNNDISQLDSSNITNMNSMFRGCTIFNQSMANFDTSESLSMNGMFIDCTAFNQDVTNFDLSKVTNTQSMFYNCTAFNKDVNHFDMSNVTNCSYMFRGASAFNKSLSNFNTAKVTNMSYMFYNATAFNQDISSFNVELVTDMTNILFGATSFSKANYDNLLIAWATQNVKTNVPFRCSSNYSLGGATETARNYLINTKSWVIQDLGGV